MPSVHASANFVRYTPPICDCSECQEVANLSVSTSVLHPTEIFLLVEQAIKALHITDISEKIQRFHQVKCAQAKNILASSILDDSIHYCTNATEMQLNNTSLLVFQYNFDNQHVSLQFDSRQVHFLLQDKLSLQPGQIKQINLNFVTNLQAVPELASELQECIAVAPDLQFSPQLCIGSLNLANCSDDIVELPVNSILLSLTFPSEQVVGIYRKLDDIFSNHQLDRNIVNYSFLKSTAQTIAKIATEGYIKDMTSFRADAKKKRKLD